MAKGTFIVRRFPIPKTSIVLGSFVYDILEPRQGSYDPCPFMLEDEQNPQTPSEDKSDIENPFNNSASRKAVLLRAIFSRFLIGSVEGDWSDIDKVSAKKATEYTLLNSDDWFEKLCGNETVQAWLEKTMWGPHRKKIYMITGYRTLSRATLGSQRSRTAAIQAQAKIPVGESQGDASGTLDAAISGEVRVDHGTDAGMQALNEMIYEIQYRKVELELFSSHSVNDAYLEQGNRWIKVFTFRDGSSPAEEEDAIDATLSEAIDVLEGYESIDEGNERVLAPVFDG